jgi:DNA-binding beta-propeller fold protein YncE
VREWGTRGSARGEFNVPHSIVIDSAGTIFVADRENSRIQRFDLAGKSLGEWTLSGKPYTLDIAQNGSLWVDMLVVPQAGVRQPTLARVDAGTGGVIGRIITPGGHGIGRVPGTERLLVPAGSKLFLLDPK